MSLAWNITLNKPLSYLNLRKPCERVLSSFPWGQSSCLERLSGLFKIIHSEVVSQASAPAQDFWQATSELPIKAVGAAPSALFPSMCGFWILSSFTHPHHFLIRQHGSLITNNDSWNHQPLHDMASHWRDTHSLPVVSWDQIHSFAKIIGWG